MKHCRVPILALFGVIASSTCAFAEDGIVVAARETEIVVTPQAAQLRLVSLPVLEFALRAAIRCKGRSLSVTLSIADTFKTLEKDDLDGKRSAEILLTVPARQLALAASHGFCIDGDDETADELLVPGLATANASLRCESDSGVAVHYASAPLRVRLRCARNPDDDTLSQVSSADR
jgi:hypothetical protein